MQCNLKCVPIHFMARKHVSAAVACLDCAQKFMMLEIMCNCAVILIVPLFLAHYKACMSA